MNGDCVARLLLQQTEAEMNIADNAFETHDALMITDADSNIIRINKAFETITGYAEEDVLGKNTRIFKSGRHGRSFYMALWQGLLRNGFWSGEVWDRHKNGNIYPKHLTITAIKNSEGVTTEYVASFLDITDQKKDEIELRRFRSIIDSSNDAIISKTLDGVIETWNRGAEKIFGYTANEVIGKSMEILIPPDRQLEETEILALLKLGEKVEHFETVRRRKDGRLIDISATISPILDKDGKVIGFSKIARDISLQKRSSRLVWDQTNFDQLTNLPNRSLFFDRLSKELLQTRRSNKHLALLFLDLDGFKPVNERYGYDAGDSVLKVVANRWLACVREADTVARLGGNEFAVILGDLGKPDETLLVAEKLIQALALKIPLAFGRECRIGTSVGISIYPDNATAMDSLLSTADAAMYESKKRGGNTYTFSDAIASKEI
jgi:diguanylate cyclase (GGDEF)-like protein/PAS domain S-box-containing protein